jgi:hypothetical protein
MCSCPVQELFILVYFRRERSRAFAGAAMKIDKLCPNIVRKRSRGDGSSNERVLSSGGVTPKNVPQSHINTDDMEVGLQREERTKNAGQNRRIRTSMVEVVHCTFKYFSVCLFCFYPYTKRFY